jgi:hypothetical protein
MSSFENKKEPFAHIFSGRLSKPCIVHPPLCLQMRQYGTQDASLVFMFRFNVGKDRHG